jgi:putative transposase
MNARCFQIFLDELAATDPESLLVLLIDNGRLHIATSLSIPDNVRLVFLPPYAPELNPIERLWRTIKDKLAEAAPQTLEELSTCITNILLQLSANDTRSLTSYDYFIQAANG